MKQIHHIDNIGEFGMISDILLPISATIFLLFLTSINVYALSPFEGSLKSVSVTDVSGTNIPPIANFSFTIDVDVVTFDASESTDPDGNITEYRWDFGDGGAGSGDVLSHKFTELSIFPVTLTIIDNSGGATVYQNNVSLVSKFAISVNFQPDTASIPVGFSPDSGLKFDSSKGYGWINLPASTKYFDYNQNISPSQAYDTVTIMPSADGIWELSVPNGDYTVTICMGDPKYPLGVADAQAEGVAVITGILSDITPWLENSSTVTVTDGLLTVTFNGSGSKRRLCWIKVSQL